MFFWVFPRSQIVVGRRFGTLCQFHLLYTQPLKMELTQGSETSANYNLTLGKYPKEHTQYSNHGESLKSRSQSNFNINFTLLNCVYVRIIIINIY